MSAKKTVPPEETVAHIMRSATRLAVLPPESPLALTNVFNVLENLGVLARRTMELQFPADESVDEVEGRRNWLTAVLFLSAANLFPGMNDLFLALSELQRGRQLPSIMPIIAGKGSGSRTTYQELTVQKRAVEAGERISQTCVKDAERDVLLRSCGTSQWTLDGYRKACNEAAPIYWIEKDAYSGLEPDEAILLLGLQIILLKQLRSKRGKRNQAK